MEFVCMAVCGLGIADYIHLERCSLDLPASKRGKRGERAALRKESSAQCLKVVHIEYMQEEDVCYFWKVSDSRGRWRSPALSSWSFTFNQPWQSQHGDSHQYIAHSLQTLTGLLIPPTAPYQWSLIDSWHLYLASIKLRYYKQLYATLFHHFSSLHQ